MASRTQENPQKKEKHHTATVILVTQETPKRVLLVHHGKIGKWLPPGGHRELSENSYETAVREVKEV